VQLHLVKGKVLQRVANYAAVFAYSSMTRSLSAHGMRKKKVDHLLWHMSLLVQLKAVTSITK
jgi:hypothetical protein